MKEITLSAGTGTPTNCVGYVGVPIEEWSSYYGMKAWNFKGFIQWLIFEIY